MRKFAVALYILTNIMATTLAATPGQVIIIRNAEEDSSGNLSKKGLERAGALASYLTETNFLLQFGEPIAIFSARPTPQSNDDTNICLETVVPTAELLKQPIHPGYSKFQSKQLASFILGHCDYDGKNIVICWKRDKIASLARAFGADPDGPFPDVYDQAWVITFSHNVELEVVQEKLLFGDTP